MSEKNIIRENNLSYGNILMIHPPYIHYSKEFIRDKNPFLPLGLLYAGQILENSGNAEIQYHDCQLYDLKDRKDLDNFDSLGINVMGAQNIAAAYEVYEALKKIVDPTKIYFGGQGIEGLTQEEFKQIFPTANQVPRSFLESHNNYWDISIAKQLDKFPDENLKVYFTNELTLLFSQNCKYRCTFCGAQTAKKERFYNVKENLKAYLDEAKRLGISDISLYATSLDFFQQALKGGDINLLEEKLHDIVDLQEEHKIKLNLRALTRADSYLKSRSLMQLVKDSGFYQFGFGVDGAADIKLLDAMSKGTKNLESEITTSFSHAEENGFNPEILYVFGIEEDIKETLEKTKRLCVDLLKSFPTSIYRGFPAKNQIPGNHNWKKDIWKKSKTYKKLITNPELFTNLGFETLANNISHPNEGIRRKVNKYAIEMSYVAHQLGRVQSFLTVPIMETDGRELMDERSFELFRDIAKNYTPEIAKELTLSNLSEYREELNKRIPKDK